MGACRFRRQRAASLFTARARLCCLSDEGFDGQLQRTVGKCDAGMANVGKCLYIASQITDGHRDSWYAAPIVFRTAAFDWLASRRCLKQAKLASTFHYRFLRVQDR
jgi:hypothetical protein